VAAAFRPELVRMEPVWVDIELKGEHTLGQTVAYLDSAHRAWFGDKTNCEACLDLIDMQGFADLIDERVPAPLRA
jgi:inosine-uridine nucleoside N-ribohydrolase